MLKMKKNSMKCCLNFRMEIDMKSFVKNKLLKNISKKWKNCYKRLLIRSNYICYVGNVQRKEEQRIQTNKINNLKMRMMNKWKVSRINKNRILANKKMKK